MTIIERRKIAKRKTELLAEPDDEEPKKVEGEDPGSEAEEPPERP
jgi:hypothetical protein